MIALREICRRPPIPRCPCRMKTRIAVLLSGRGSNFAALADAVSSGRVPAEIALVLSNVEQASGLALGRRLGFETVALPHTAVPRREHEAAVLDALRRARVEWVCLAGYMRLLSADFVAAFPERILNVHPSLLPSFPGLHPQRQALAAGVKISGCTVHLVDSGLDSGPIVWQRAVAVLDSDDEESLAARILAEEHFAYPEALAALLSRRWRLDGRRVQFGEAFEGG